MVRCRRDEASSIEVPLGFDLIQSLANQPSNHLLEPGPRPAVRRFLWARRMSGKQDVLYCRLRAKLAGAMPKRLDRTTTGMALLYNYSFDLSCMFSPAFCMASPARSMSLPVS